MLSSLGIFRLTLLLMVGNFFKMSLAQCLTGNDSPAMMNQDSKKELIDARFEFALETLKKTAIIDSKNNLFYSPYSLHQALTLAYFGARGTTETALKNALRIPENLSKVDIQRYYSYENSVKRFRESQNSSTSYEYKSANKLWLTSTKKVRDCMLDFFGDELEQVDFRMDPEAVRNRINDWVSNVTKGNIRDLIPSGGITEDSDLVLANAVYFKGLWQSRFDPANSKKDIFYVSGSRSSFITFMRQKGNFNHVVSEELGAHVLQLPYKGGDISMYIFLPPFATARSMKASSDGATTDQILDQGRDGVHQLIERITGTAKGAAEFRELLDDGILPREVEVSLPRFTIELELPVTELLRAMGAGELLMPSSADLRGLVDEEEKSLHLGDAVHRARIEVNEEGTTAVAATALFTFRSSRPIEPAIFNANHPFLYFIYDRLSRTILFSGIYRVPPPVQSAAAADPMISPSA